MGSPVKLYVYDLSNGLAKQLSLQLTGKQIDGIWHTSVVVFNKEFFYGQGICTTKPGQSHHGQPLQIVDIGETAIDEDTLNDYIQEMNAIYTADKYHLLDFNCNSFTNDVIGFLTGGSIPSWIKDLPADFLSTPFGAALRPTIDSMFRRPTRGAVSSQSYNPPVASSLLQSVAAQAEGSSAAQQSYMHAPPAVPLQPAAGTVAAPLQICSNLQHFRSILASHRAISAFFTSRTCPPCKIVEPIFEDMAWQKASKGVAFVKIDVSAMLGGEVAGVYNVRATPTFLFFLDGQKIYELKGADVAEMRSQVDLLIHQAFPPHPHAIKKLSAIRAISLEPILFTQVPSLDTVQSKLFSFIDDGISSDTFGNVEKEGVKKVLFESTIPFLKTVSDTKPKASAPSAATRTKVCEEWVSVSTALVKALPREQLFPLIDLWRVGLLDNTISSWCASASLVTPRGANKHNPVLLFLSHAASDIVSLTKPVILTTLRMLANAFSNTTLARTMLNSVPPVPSSSPRQDLTAVLVTTLLHKDAAVRTAAASLAFNISAYVQKPRVEAMRSDRRGEDAPSEDGGEGDWEVEVVSAMVEALRMERSSEDVVHRLTASLAFLIHLSPFYESQLKPLLEVLQVADMLKAKLNGGSEGCGEKGVVKKDVRSLITEVADELC